MRDARERLVEIADEFQNDYLTVGRYAERNGLREEDASALLDLARRVRDSAHPES